MVVYTYIGTELGDSLSHPTIERALPQQGKLQITPTEAETKMTLATTLEINLWLLQSNTCVTSYIQM